VSMKGLAHTIPAGHRLRVAISTSYWPMIWPSPDPATITVHEAGCRADLPIHDAFVALGDDLFAQPEDARTGPVTELREGAEKRWITNDLGARRTEVVASRDDGVYVIDDIGTEQSFTRVRSSSVVDGEPTSARADVECRATYRRGDWDVRVETDITLTCTAESFRMQGRLTAFDGGELFAERRFDHEIERDHL
jgi:uncharacterized protein